MSKATKKQEVKPNTCPICGWVAPYGQIYKCPCGWQRGSTESETQRQQEMLRRIRGRIKRGYYKKGDVKILRKLI